MRWIAMAGVALASGAVPATVGASTYGRVIARHLAPPAASLRTSFAGVARPKAFLLVVTEPTHETLHFTWSIRCASASPRESGGATGAATVSSGHWVKRVPVAQLEHATACAGSISGSAAASPVLVRVFAQ
jgi:hypothetical protein